MSIDTMETAEVGEASRALHYVYGVTRPGVPLPDTAGVGEVRPRLVESADLALLAGDVPAGVAIATRENLLAHSNLLDAIAREDTVLPVRFGTVVEDLDTACAELLEGCHDEYLAQLADLDGAVQFSLRAVYDEDVVLAEILAEDDEIGRLNEMTRAAPLEAMRAERVRLGELVMAAFGVKRPVDADADRTLLSVLRDDLDLTGTKYGCGEGQCAACTVLIDGQPTKSCLTKVGAVGTKRIVTIEGLGAQGKLHPVQEAFLEAEALQCGWGTPGMILGAVGLLRRNPNPSEAEIVTGMNGHICRCGTYPRIVSAIKIAAKKGVRA